MSNKVKIDEFWNSELHTVPSLCQIRQVAIANEKAFGVTRLREQYRMKPKHDAAPAFYYKNPYGRGENPCYKVADCIPLRHRSRSKPTEKQILAGKIAGLKSKLRSKLCKTGKWLYEQDKQSWVTLDSETTGLGTKDEIIELGVIDWDGNTLLNQRFKPTCDISSGAYSVHGISLEQLEDEPTWADYIDQVKTILSGKKVIIFNQGFDLGMLESTCQAFSLDCQWINDLNSLCAMQIAVEALGSTNSYGSISLRDAAWETDVVWRGDAHSAIADCNATRDVLKSIEKNYSLVLSQIEAAEAAKKVIN